MVGDTVCGAAFGEGRSGELRQTSRSGKAPHVGDQLDVIGVEDLEELMKLSSRMTHRPNGLGHLVQLRGDASDRVMHDQTSLLVEPLDFDRIRVGCQDGSELVVREEVFDHTMPGAIRQNPLLEMISIGVMFTSERRRPWGLIAEDDASSWCEPSMQTVEKRPQATSWNVSEPVDSEGTGKRRLD